MGSPSLGALNFSAPGTQEGMELEKAGYFFYIKKDFCGNWVIAVNPVTGEAKFWFKHWTVSSSLPLFSNTDYTRTFKFNSLLVVKASWQILHNGKLEQSTDWNLVGAFSVGRLDFEFISDPDALVPVSAHAVDRDYAVIIRAYARADSKTFEWEDRELIPSFTPSGNSSASGGPCARELEGKVLSVDDLLGKKIPIFKTDIQIEGKDEKFVTQLVLEFSKAATAGTENGPPKSGK